jgi:hypothetical protein
MTHAAARRKAQNQPNYENLPIEVKFSFGGLRSSRPTPTFSTHRQTVI